VSRAGERGGLEACAPLRALSYRFGVRCEDARLAAQVAVLCAGLREDKPGAPVEHWYALMRRAGGAGTFDVVRDGALVAEGQRPGDAVGWLVWDVNRSATEASADALLFHAGALDAAGAGVLLPGASGSGKSTLTAGLVCAGFGYLSDELVALDVSTGRLLSYAKPITLKEGSFAVLPDLHPDRDLPPAGRPWDGAEWQVPVGGTTGRALGAPCPPQVLVFPRYDPMAPTRLTPLSDTEAFLSLALHTVNLRAHCAAGSAALGRVVAGACCYALTISDLGEACARVRELAVAALPAAEWAGAAHVP
jgi:hypothetical protein